MPTTSFPLSEQSDFPLILHGNNNDQATESDISYGDFVETEESHISEDKSDISDNEDSRADQDQEKESGHTQEHAQEQIRRQNIHLRDQNNISVHFFDFSPHTYRVREQNLRSQFHVTQTPDPVFKMKDGKSEGSGRIYGMAILGMLGFALVFWLTQGGLVIR
ncbi:hypothetical protein F4678DRAFT_459871 [Xylaria arbuscula]|nr:hypothetical protein F4678DRAFT_459871 [Xylaria arbuscula]